MAISVSGRCCLLSVLLCPLTAAAEFNQCSIDTPAAVHGSKIWLDMARPLNITIERLGRLPDSAGAKLISLAYQSWQQGNTEQQISTAVLALCHTFTVDALLADIIESPWPAERTACSDAAESLLSAIDMTGSNRPSAAQLVYQITGDEPAPNLLALAEQAATLKRQNTADMQIMEQVYASCAAKDTAYKKALGKEFYVE